MSTSPTVLRNSGIPFLTIASGVLVIYFVAKAVLIPGAAAVFSLIMGALVALAGFWWFRRSQNSTVIIDKDTFTVSRAGHSESFNRSEVTSIDLSSPLEQVKFRDGTGVALPLEGRSLVQAGILLSPRTDF